MRSGENSMTKSARILLRHDLMFLKCFVKTAIMLHPGSSPEDRVTLGVLHDYLAWLAVDAMTDEALARRLVTTIAKLQEELHAEAERP